MTYCGMLVCSFFVKGRFTQQQEHRIALNQSLFHQGSDGTTCEYQDIFELFNIFCTEYTSFLDDEKSQKLFSVDYESINIYENEIYRAMSFVIKFGSELKTGEFKPEYAGKLNFYLSAVDGILKSDLDNPSIGLLLCKSKNDLVAEYSLKDISKPMGVSEYKITGTLPSELKAQLPAVEDIQRRIGKLPGGVQQDKNTEQE